MMTVRDELVKIHEDTDSLVSLVGSGTDISRDLSDDLSRLSSEVQYALQDQSRATAEYVGALDDRLRDLRDRVASAIEDAGNKISWSNVGAGLIGGLFSLVGTTVAAKLVGSAIHEAAHSRPPTADELKERALLVLVAQIQNEQSWIPVETIIARATGANAILSPEDVRRILLLLATDGALESRSDEAGAPLRVNSRHPKSEEVLGIQASAKAPKLQRAAFVDLGPEFGVSMSRSEVDKVNNITIVKIKNEYIVRIDYSERNYAPMYYDSRPWSTKEEAERARLLAHSRLVGSPS